MTRNRVLLVGLDGIDWASFVGELAAHRLPALAALAKRGMAVPLRALPPLHGPANWTTIATGQPPEQHGVVRYTEGWAGGVRAAGLDGWAAPPMWQRTAAAGLATVAVGWPCSASPGVAMSGEGARLVDDRYLRIDGADHDRWPLPLHCVPTDLREALRDARTHPGEVPADAVAPFLTDGNDARGTAVRFALASAANARAALRMLLTDQPWRLAMVQFSWLGDLRGLGGDDGALAAGWRFLDALVGSVVAEAPDADIVVASPGWREGVGMMIVTPHERAGPTSTTRPNETAGVLDVAPTVLALLGLCDATLLGRSLVAREAVQSATLAPSVVAVVPDDLALLEQVVAAGFAPPPGPPAGWRAEGLAILAEALVASDPALADTFACAALAYQADCISALRTLASAAIALRRFDTIADIADRLEAIAPWHPWVGLARGSYEVLAGTVGAAVPWLLDAERAEDVEALLRVGAAWLLAERPRDAARVFERVVTIAPELPAARLGLALVAVAERDFATAETRLRRVLAIDPGHGEAWRQLIDLFDATGRGGEATVARTALARNAG